MKLTSILILFFSIVLAFSGCNRDCEDVTCLNGAKCDNGNCICADGWEGLSCAEQKTPVKMIITSLEVSRFLVSNPSGSSWDIGSGPDIFFQIYLGNGQWYISSTFVDADPGFIYTFSPLSIEINNVMNQHVLYLRDYDDDFNWEYMGGVEWFPYGSNTNGFPTTIILEDLGNVVFTLTVSYVW